MSTKVRGLGSDDECGRHKVQTTFKAQVNGPMCESVVTRRIIRWISYDLQERDRTTALPELFLKTNLAFFTKSTSTLLQ